MRLYAVVLIAWTAIVAASPESNVTSLDNNKAAAEPRDSSANRIAQPYATTTVEARDSEWTVVGDAQDRVDDASILSGSTTRIVSARESDGDFEIQSSTSGSPIYAALPAETIDENLQESLDNGELGYAIPEDALLVENAGSFGQRVRQDQSGERKIIGTTVKTTIRTTVSSTDGKSFNSVATPLENDHVRVYASTTGEPFVLALKKENDPSEDSSSDLSSEAVEALTEKPDKISEDAESAGTKSSPDKEPSFVLSDENDVVPEYLPKPQARSFRARNNVTEDVAKSKNVATSTSIEIVPSLQSIRFSSPIVVPDLPNREAQDVSYADREGDAVAFEMIKNVDSIPKNDIWRSAKGAAANGIPTSSIMLNPLQVGITLVNADEVDLVGNGEQFAATETRDYLQDDLQRLAVADERTIASEENQSDVASFQDEDLRRVEEKKPVADTRTVSDSSVEIQKSIELYHTAPIQEIHYPVEYVRQTAQLDVIQTDDVGNAQRSKQDDRSESRSNYDIYRGNDIAEQSAVEAHATSAVASHKFNRPGYNGIEEDASKPTASTSIAEYESDTRHEQVAPFENHESRYNDVKPPLLLANQYDDDASYEQRSNVRSIFDSGNNNGAPLRNGKPVVSPTRQELANEYARPYAPTTHWQEQQQQPFRSPPPETRRPENPSQLLLKIIPNGSPEAGFLVPIPRPYPVEKIVEKTVHVPHPIEIEKVIERKVPYPVERVIEKQVPVPMAVPVPQLFPVHVHVPVEKQIRLPHLYPIHVERLVEKRIPYTMQRLLVQPTHPRPLPANYPVYPISSGSSIVEKNAEKPAIVRPVRPYRPDAIDGSESDNGATETKFITKYHHQKAREPILSSESFLGGIALEPLQNATFFGGREPSTYIRPSVYYNAVDNGIRSWFPATTNIRLVILPKKFNGHHLTLVRQHAAPATETAVPYAATLPMPLRRQIVYNLVEKDKPIKDVYLGPVPPRKAFTSQAKPPSFSTSSATQSPATTAALRRARQQVTQYPGSFRQSKMEYGFKPPMVPSVQYDENTASQVDN